MTTLIAVDGVFMTPIGRGRACLVWGYALGWFLANDRVKLAAYRVFARGKLALPSTRQAGRATPAGSPRMA